MGEYADLILNGLVDQYTGEVIDGDSLGYPRSKSKKKKRRSYKKIDGQFKCEKCGRHFNSEQAVSDHTVDMHTPEGQKRRQRQKLGLPPQRTGPIKDNSAQDWQAIYVWHNVI